MCPSTMCHQILEVCPVNYTENVSLFRALHCGWHIFEQYCIVASQYVITPEIYSPVNPLTYHQGTAQRLTCNKLVGLV